MPIKALKIFSLINKGIQTIKLTAKNINVAQLQNIQSHILTGEKAIKYRDNNINHVPSTTCTYSMQVREYAFWKGLCQMFQTYQNAFSSGIKSSNKPAKKFMACILIKSNKRNVRQTVTWICMVNRIKFSSPTKTEIWVRSGMQKPLIPLQSAANL